MVVNIKPFLALSSNVEQNNIICLQLKLAHWVIITLQNPYVNLPLSILVPEK